MIKELNIDATDETPKVILDPGQNKFEFSGKSLPEDVTIFFNPIIEWIEEYSKSPNMPTNVVFKMDYFNTASAKIILDILMEFENIHEEHKCMSIDWYFREDDEDLEEVGDELSELVEIPFNLIEY